MSFLLSVLNIIKIIFLIIISIMIILKVIGFIRIKRDLYLVNQFIKKNELTLHFNEIELKEIKNEKIIFFSLRNGSHNIMSDLKLFVKIKKDKLEYRFCYLRDNFLDERDFILTKKYNSENIFKKINKNKFDKKLESRNLTFEELIKKIYGINFDDNYLEKKLVVFEEEDNFTTKRLYLKEEVITKKGTFKRNYILRASGFETTVIKVEKVNIENFIIKKESTYSETYEYKKFEEVLNEIEEIIKSNKKLRMKFILNNGLDGFKNRNIYHKILKEII